MAERMLRGWKMVLDTMFIDDNGNYIISLSTLKNKYGPEILSMGLAFKMRLGRAKREEIVTYPSLIIRYLQIKQQNGELIEKNIKNVNFNEN